MKSHFHLLDRCWRQTVLHHCVQEEKSLQSATASSIQISVNVAVPGMRQTPGDSIEAHHGLSTLSVRFEAWLT